MGDSPGSHRPAKRVKHGHHHHPPIGEYDARTSLSPAVTDAGPFGAGPAVNAIRLAPLQLLEPPVPMATASWPTGSGGASQSPDFNTTWYEQFRVTPTPTPPPVPRMQAQYSPFAATPTDVEMLHADSPALHSSSPAFHSNSPALHPNSPAPYPNSLAFHSNSPALQYNSPALRSNSHTNSLTFQPDSPALQPGSPVLETDDTRPSPQVSRTTAFPTRRAATSRAPSTAGGPDSSPAASTGSRGHSLFSQPVRHRPLLPATEATSASTTEATSATEANPSESTLVVELIVSPFHDLLERFAVNDEPQFIRPEGLKEVNSYVKFKIRPKRRYAHNTNSNAAVGAMVNQPSYAQRRSSTSPSFIPAKLLHGPSRSESGSPDLTEIGLSSPESISFIQWVSLQDGSPLNWADVCQQQHLASKPPQTLPHFGLEVKMDGLDNMLWDFYIKSWCPGRSIIEATNLWLKDFAQLHRSRGVLAAIQSLAGVYVYDYIRSEGRDPRTGIEDKDARIEIIRARVNERFAQAEACLEGLLRSDNPQADSDELVTIASLLAMQDVVLVGRRRKKPDLPRWLECQLQAERVLQKTDPGARYWRSQNVQISSLRASQSIIVGRAVIISYMMMPLPKGDDFDPGVETARFQWLLYGSEDEMYAIHGGCGFSKKLLHMISQITYCAARLQQDPESEMVPYTARHLLEQLLGMRQWTPAYRGKEVVISPQDAWTVVKGAPQIIDWIRSLPPGRTIELRDDMTLVTAEAWRFAIIVYLLCRVMRLPRNHPEVIAKMTDLASCIRIMPTSGHHFTAQAPLFPVFLLGLLAVQDEHREISQRWFDSVVGEPVRSSVPPLYESLTRIWGWIGRKVELPSTRDIARLPDSIGKRKPWWERLVAQVQLRESETLCLT